MVEVISSPREQPKIQIKSQTSGPIPVPTDTPIKVQALDLANLRTEQTVTVPRNQKHELNLILTTKMENE